MADEIKGTDTQGNAGLVGSVNPSVGLSNLIGDIGLDNMLNNFGASTSSATSSATASLASGDKNVASGKSSAGTLGSLKSAGLILAALAFYAIYAFSSKGGK